MPKDLFWDTAPVFAIGGFSGAGKTTLIEQLIPVLIGKGLKVAVLKHDVHGVQIDRPGKDSERFYQAGADVVLDGPDEHFMRLHEEQPLLHRLRLLSRCYDLVLVEGHKNTPLPKIWLLDDSAVPPPKDQYGIIDILARDSDRLAQTLALLEPWLLQRWRKVPVYGCVLIGGKSSRMGRPKHLLEFAGRTWLEHTVARISPMVDEVVIVGGGDVPTELSHCIRLPDVPSVCGPLAGIVAAMRWAPDVSWLVCACDMPQISEAAVRWLLDGRAPGIWATLPGLCGDGYVEPLLAHYDGRAHALFEALLARQIYAPSALVPHAKIKSPKPPKHLLGAWQNVNSEAGLENIIDSSPGTSA